MERITDHHLSWAQGFRDSEVPGVVRKKWFERRHQLHHVHRWGRDRTAYFQTAFMNGTGTMLWDNVFGAWVGCSECEKAILRSMLPIQRRFTALFSGERWTPLVPTTAAEWQYAAQCTEGRKYPWGIQAPQPNDNLGNGFGDGTTPVKQFPAGRSPFGIYDLCGNTWEWTESERADGVNRFASLRGGSYYQARKGSWSWCMNGGPQEAAFACKYLSQWPGLDRCATVGFRCVADGEA